MRCCSLLHRGLGEYLHVDVNVSDDDTLTAPFDALFEYYTEKKLWNLDRRLRAAIRSPKQVLLDSDSEEEEVDQHERLHGFGARSPPASPEREKKTAQPVQVESKQPEEASKAAKEEQDEEDELPDEPYPGA